jgi:RsiW-degrading membrane proteinase PrsW (M82 family)
VGENVGMLIRGAGFVAGGVVFWLIYFNLKDRLQPEPRRLLLLAFLYGGLAALVGLAAYRLAEWLGAPEFPGAGRWELLLYCLALVGPIEEGAKFLVARALIFRWKQFDEPIDGLIYASAVGVGFAAVETLLYLPHLDWPRQLARALTSPLTHSLFAAIWGLGLIQARLRASGRGTRFLLQALPLAASMLLHGFYDFLVIGPGATVPASGIVLGLWVWMILYARRVVRGRSRPYLLDR